MEGDKKRSLREIKRQVKKDGNRSRRNYLKQQLLDDPENAHWDEYDFKHNSSTYLNGFDHDPTRRRNEYENEMYSDLNEEERECF